MIDPVDDSDWQAAQAAQVQRRSCDCLLVLRNFQVLSCVIGLLLYVLKGVVCVPAIRPARAATGGSS